jgi:hypothetical protein
MFWVLVFMTFSFPYGPYSDVVAMRAWKHPVTFNSMDACEETGVELRRLSPKEYLQYSCREISKSGNKRL